MHSNARTGNDGKAPVILYDYQPSRNGDHAAEFLRDFNGYIHSDGYPNTTSLQISPGVDAGLI